MNISYWEQDIFLPRADVVVIGAGLVGLHAAWRLRQLNESLRVVVLEAGPWPGSASLRNAGFACFGSPSELLDDLGSRSKDEVAALVSRRLDGLRLLRQGLGDAAIGYGEVPAYEVFSPDQEALAEACLRALGELNGMVGPIMGSVAKGQYPVSTEAIYSPAPIPSGAMGFSQAIHIKGEGQIHPGLMMSALSEAAKASGVIIHHGWPVHDIHIEDDEVVVEGEKGMRLAASKVLVATNGFTKKLLPDLDVTPARNQVLVTEPIPGLELHGNFHARAGYVYFRNVGNRLLIGGFRDLEAESETTAEFGFSEGIQQALQQYVDVHLLPKGSWRIAHRWSGTLGVGDTKSPIVKEVKPGLWCAVRLGGMGVALGAGLGVEAAEKLAV